VKHLHPGRGREGPGPATVIRDVTAKRYRGRLMRQKIASLEAGQDVRTVGRHSGEQTTSS
jgi:hypothetical protein